MICVFKGRPTPDESHADKYAGELQARLHERFKTADGKCLCEHGNQRNEKNARLQVMKERRLRDNLNWVERTLLAKFPLLQEELMEDVVVQEIVDLSVPQETMLSPSLQLLGLTVDDLPNGSYGNGLTCNYTVPVGKFVWDAEEPRAAALEKAANFCKEAEAQGFSCKVEPGISKAFVPGIQQEEGHYLVNLRLSWWCVAPVHVQKVKDNWLEVCDLMEK